VRGKETGRRGSGRLWKVLFGVALGIALAFAALNALGINPLSGRTGMVIVGENGAFRLRDVGEMVTQEAVLTRVQTVSDSREIFGVRMPFTQKRYIYSYDVTVRAGVDFSQVEIAPDAAAKTLRIAMPPVRIIDASVDPDSLQVYEERQNAFNALHIKNFNDSMGVMIREGKEYAVEHGLLDRARVNAEALIRVFLAQTYPESEYTYIFEWAE
jgi:hypothetical protein